jgi:hypothetical protein
VVVQHLSPDHKSMMSNLLARHTEHARDRGRGRPAPGGRSCLPDPARGPHARHDRTSAPDAEESAGADLTHRHLPVLAGRGIRPARGGRDPLGHGYRRHARRSVAINAAGGFLLSQEPESAKFDGMPRSVIATGIVDAILPAEETPAAAARPHPQRALQGTRACGQSHPLRDDDQRRGGVRDPATAAPDRRHRLLRLQAGRRSCAASSGACRCATRRSSTNTSTGWRTTAAKSSPCAAKC